jgi:trigger factor
MKVEKVSVNRVKYTFDVTPHEFEHGLDHAFEHVQKDVELKDLEKVKYPEIFMKPNLVLNHYMKMH